MNILSSIARIWLTKTTKPFIFENRYDEVLPFQDIESLGLYVHLPFCKKICKFCPYCKTIYEKTKAEKYIKALLKEIELVGSRNTIKKDVTSLYFGGGSPAILTDYIDLIIKTIQKYFNVKDGIGIELHPEDVSKSSLLKLKNAGVSRISIGIQSFQDEYLQILGRDKIDYQDMFEAIKSIQFETVSMDFIFALPNQTIINLKKDIDTAFTNGANHVAIYPFINFKFTNSNIKNIKSKEKRKLLDEITDYCMQKGYYRNSIWTFTKDPSKKYSSMTRDNFLGFGCSATTLLKNQFKINTFDIDEYVTRINQKKLPTSLTAYFTKQQRMVYYLFWTAYTTRVNPDDFYDFFNVKLEKLYGMELKLAKLFGFIRKKQGIYEMSKKGAFYYHYFENFYTLAYIDKMWGIMKNEAFPAEIRL